MSTTVLPSADPTPTRTGHRWPWWLLRVVTVLTTLSAFTQAALAGGLIAGRIEMLPLHSNNGLLLALGTLLLLVALVLAWRPGRAPAWTLLAGLVLLLATVVQLVLGFSRSLALHVPLGVTVVVVQVLLLVRAWRHPLPGRRP